MIVWDGGNNVANSSIRVNVVDTTPPVFLPEPDQVVNADAEWEIQPPAAEDNCSEVDVHIYSIETKHLDAGR